MRERGFTLIELAVVVAILSLISVGLLGVFSSVRTNTALAETRNNHDEIYKALVRFAAANGRLPCPAPFGLAPTDANYGSEEAGVAGVCTDGPPDAIPFPPPNNEYAVGNIPFRTLGLGPEHRFDGWDHQFTYVVAIAATDDDPAGVGASPNVLNRVSWLNANIPTTQLNIFNNVDPGLPEPVNQPMTAGGEVAVVISYGPNGSGAWTIDGAQLAAPVATALNELENLDATNVIFVDAEYSEDDVTPFDDLIRGYTEAQLMQPLLQAGMDADRVSIAQAQLRRIRNALVAYMISTPILSAGADPDGFPTSFIFGPPAGCNCSLPPNNDPGTCGGATPGPECASCLDPAPPAPIPGCQQSVFRAVPSPIAPTGVNTGALGLPANDQIDPWGTAISYNVFPGNLAWDVGDPAPAAGDGVWSGNAAPGNGILLQSFGPNAVNDGCAPGPLVDDICLALTVQELIGLLAASGEPVD